MLGSPFKTMAIEKVIDNILNTNSKIRIIRFFLSKREDFIATGCEIARLTELSAPTELLKSEKTDKEFLSLVSEGIVLWDRLAHEDSF